MPAKVSSMCIQRIVLLFEFGVILEQERATSGLPEEVSDRSKTKVRTSLVELMQRKPSAIFVVSKEQSLKLVLTPRRLNE